MRGNAFLFLLTVLRFIRKIKGGGEESETDNETCYATPKTRRDPISRFACIIRSENDLSD